jgi:stalled ribosome alternative rescue factor ArfA
MHNQRFPLIASFVTSTILFIQRKEQNQNGRTKYQQHDDEQWVSKFLHPLEVIMCKVIHWIIILKNQSPSKPPSKQCYESLGLRRRALYLVA